MSNALPFRVSPHLGLSVVVPMQQFAVSIRHIWQDWPVYDIESIQCARALYDQGRAEVCTGRVGEHFVLYCIPRRVQTAARRWFSHAGSF